MVDTNSLHFLLGIGVLAASIIFSIVYIIYSFVFAPRGEISSFFPYENYNLMINFDTAAAEEDDSDYE